MKEIIIFDTTLRDGEQAPGCSMSIEQKIIIAKKLDEMGVNIIEAGFAASSSRDFQAIKEISKLVKNATVTSLARCNKNDIDIAFEAIKEAKNPRLHIFIATSDIHIKYKLNKTKEEIKEIVRKYVKYAKSKCNDIEFSLEDATRSDKNFACEIIDIAISNGATTINIPDTVGYTTPEEFIEFITYIKNNSRINEATISIHCHNDLGMATANSMSAINVGASQIECTINGIGERAGNTPLEEVVAIIDTRQDRYNCQTSIDTTKIYEISTIVSNITNSVIPNNKPIVGINAFRHESGIHQAGVIKNKKTYEIMSPEHYGVYTDNIVIGIHSGKNAIIEKITNLGLDDSEYDIINITKKVKSFCEENKNISEQEFIEIINKFKISKPVKSLIKTKTRVKMQ